MDKDNKKCKVCNSILKKDALFCHKCGSKVLKLSIICSKCKTELTKDELFCHKCGTKNDYYDNLLSNFGDKSESLKLIVEVLTSSNKPMTIYDMQMYNKVLNDYSTYKIFALLKILIDNQIVMKTINKKTLYFELIDK